MPFTPLHFGPSATLGLICHKHLDLFVLVSANVIVDMEPLMIWLLGLDMPLHPMFHSLTIGGLLGVVWGLCVYRFRGYLIALMAKFKVVYKPHFKQVLLSGVLGVWLNVLIDAMLYNEIKLIFPFSFNPLYGLASEQTLVILCALFFIPVIILKKLSK